MSATEDKSSIRTPSAETLAYAFKLSVDHDKPIMTDYWTDSLSNKIFIGVKESSDEDKKQEKLLIKSSEEYTSPIQNILKSKGEYIIATENSIYIVSSSITAKKVK